MNHYSEALKLEAKKLRMLGKTYFEINSIFKTSIPKSTLRSWFYGVPLPTNYKNRIVQLNKEHLSKVRISATNSNRIKRIKFLEALDINNFEVSKEIFNINTAKIALSMLCLGEASKSTTTSPFYLGNSNPKIIILFIKLLKAVYPIDMNKFRCTVQCRADQNQEDLKKYWQGICGIPLKQFYKTRIDSRSIGKPTAKSGYHGVLKIDYLDSKVQLDLESLSNLVYNNVANQG